MLQKINCPDHEEVIHVTDTDSGLEAIIAIHSTKLGPAAGGLRMRPYGSFEDALADVLNLSRGMTFKNAAAGLPLGGGKAVIIGDPATGKTPQLLRALGRAVDQLQGRYWTAEDMGMTPADMAEISRETQFVAGLPNGPFASGDPSPVTAEGVFNAMKLGAGRVFGSRDLRGLRVAVQGLGHVGWHLCEMLNADGAELVVADTVAERVSKAQTEFGATVVQPVEIHAAEADIFAPCAIGGILNAETIPAINARLVCGAANNQLSDPSQADGLAARGILYLPDYVANGGGIINVAGEILAISAPDAWVSERLDALQRTMSLILETSANEHTSPAHVADRIVHQMMLQEKAS